jgi:hypothetical protein
MSTSKLPRTRGIVFSNQSQSKVTFTFVAVFILGDHDTDGHRTYIKV